ncbi:MAG: HAD family phosphatase [Atopobiaceae bacterium]|nr:HAD family phosphatase [Atopobiaceae bacterium]
MPYKLLALDMDGTLLTSDKRVSPRTRASLEHLAQRGVPLAYCTGRNVLELLEYPRELPFVRYGVLASGAVVHDFATQEDLEVHALDPDVLVGAMEVAQAEGPMTHVMALSQSVVRPDDLRDMARFGMGIYQGMFDNICTRERDLEGWVRMHPGEVIKINFYHANAASRDKTRRRLEESGLPLTLANAEQGSVECSALGVSKGKGLASLAKMLGIELSEVVAVGDSVNDAEALKVAGMPVAMGKASAGARQLARLVVADNDHDGIVEAIERLF